MGQRRRQSAERAWSGRSPGWPWRVMTVAARSSRWPRRTPQAAVREVEGERYAPGIDLPEAECGGPGADAVAMGEASRGVRGEVPGHDALGDNGSPGEFAVGALPGVAHIESRRVDRCEPAQVYAPERR